MYKYAQLNSDNVVVGISNLIGMVDNNPNMILLNNIKNHEEIFLDWQYIDNQFISPPPLSEKEILQNEINAVTLKLRKIYEDEQFAKFLGDETILTNDDITEKGGLLEQRNALINSIAKIK